MAENEYPGNPVMPLLRITSGSLHHYGEVVMRKPARPFMIRVSVIVGMALAAAVSLSPAVAAGQTPQIIRFDGGAYDRAGAITVDGVGNSYLAGAVDEGGAGSSFAVVKLGPDGVTRWTARYDGSRGGVGGQANAVAVDAAGNVYAAGYIGDGVMFNTNYDYLVVKFGAGRDAALGAALRRPGRQQRLRRAGRRRRRGQRVRDRLLLRRGLRL